VGGPSLDFETWESTNASANPYYSGKVGQCPLGMRHRDLRTPRPHAVRNSRLKSPLRGAQGPAQEDIGGQFAEKWDSSQETVQPITQHGTCRLLGWRDSEVQAAGNRVYTK
jgi:hypothetical protein